MLTNELNRRIITGLVSRLKRVAGVAPILYDLKALFTASDQTFTDGQVLDSAAEGVEAGSLTVVDTSTGTVKIVGNELEIVGTNNWGQTGVIGSGITRTCGKAIFGKMVFSAGSNTFFSLDPTEALSIIAKVSFFMSKTQKFIFGSQVGVLEAATTYEIIIVLGGYDINGVPFKEGDTVSDFLYGSRVYIKGGDFPAFTLLSSLDSYNDSTLYPFMQTQYVLSPCVAQNLLIPTSPLTPSIMFQPVFLDTFTGTDGDNLRDTHVPDVVGSVDGTVPAWESGADTWTIQGNAAVNSGYTGTLNTRFLTDDMGVAEGLIDANITGANNQTGHVTSLDSKTSPANYIETYYDFSDSHVKCIKTVAGTPTALIDVATSYVAGAQARVIFDYDTVTPALKLKIYYNNALIGAEQTITDTGIVGNTRHGIMSTDSANTLDNFTVHNRTNSAWDTEISAATGSIY